MHLRALDGKNLFDACSSEVSHTEWQVDETVYRLIREKAIPERFFGTVAAKFKAAGYDDSRFRYFATT